MVRPVVLEGWIKRVLRGCGPADEEGNFDVFGHKVDFDRVLMEGREIVVLLSGVRAEGMKLRVYGLMFDREGCLLKYECCEITKYVSAGVLEEGVRRFEKDKREGMKWVVENVVDELEKQGLMSWWFKAMGG
jgi:hypothetical protein